MEFSNPFLIGSSVLQIKHKPDRQLWQEEGGHVVWWGIYLRIRLEHDEEQWPMGKWG